MNYCEEGKASTTCKKCQFAIIDRGIIIGCSNDNDSDGIQMQQNYSSKSKDENPF